MFASALLVTLLASAGSAQVQRTFVSGLGSDSDPCSLTAPCRTFTRAISQTNTGGEVIVLDSAGYGPAVITKSISLIAPPGVYAGISVFSGDGIDINAGGSDAVILRGLTVNNQGSTGSGVVFNAGHILQVENCEINGFSNFGSGAGLSLLGSSLFTAGPNLQVRDSIMRGISLESYCNLRQERRRSRLTTSGLSGTSMGYSRMTGPTSLLPTVLLRMRMAASRPPLPPRRFR